MQQRQESYLGPNHPLQQNFQAETRKKNLQKILCCDLLYRYVWQRSELLLNRKSKVLGQSVRWNGCAVCLVSVVISASWHPPSVLRLRRSLSNP